MLSQLRYRLALRSRWNRFRSLSRLLGMSAAFKYLLLKKGKIRGKELRLHPKQLRYPITLRPPTSDQGVFQQIFLEEEYACLDLPSEAGLIIDCGANVGYSSAYFLSKFPQCQVVAVEPDPHNFAVLERNLAPYGDRVKCLQAGIWSHPTTLKMVEEMYRDGLEWSKQVRECYDGETAELQGIDVDTLLKESGFDRISLLKIDVEGAEVMMFAGDYQSWLGKVDSLAIELHDDSHFGNATEIFHQAIQGQDFELSKSGELTICNRLKPHPLKTAA
ncbi:SAM-dependent methyltransferase [Planctomycetales bacterium 10988]|nr:SAM-dependent methyltransferase [Planctomycetales bacterium 10988]